MFHQDEKSKVLHILKYEPFFGIPIQYNHYLIVLSSYIQPNRAALVGLDLRESRENGNRHEYREF